MSSRDEAQPSTNAEFELAMAWLRAVAAAGLSAEAAHEAAQASLVRLMRDLDTAWSEAEQIVATADDPRLVAELETFAESFHAARAERTKESAAERS
ncbi:hypothetical protein [Nocardia altamirensis]|uniref:hypothetical protein n=1 Tax=Nocardia altamirensis TaxID=472158 RepID=UPI00084041F0|nr:hypothetical protein [Nocardia altamirensis]